MAMNKRINVQLLYESSYSCDEPVISNHHMHNHCHILSLVFYRNVIVVTFIDPESEVLGASHRLVKGQRSDEDHIIQTEGWV
jgi:hypothetical protein